MKRAKNIALQFAFGFSFVSAAILFIPMYFFTNLYIQHFHLQEEMSLREYSQFVENKIYSISSQQEHFYFPRSIVYKSALLDKNQEIIFSLIKNPVLETNNFYKRDNLFFYKKTLKENVLNGKYLIIAKDVSYKKLALEISIMILGLLLILFTFSFFILKRSLSPFEKANKDLKNFFKDILHELKTPLGVAKLNLEILQEKKDTKELSRANGALHTIENLYSDLEFIIQERNISYRIKSIDLGEFVAFRIDFFKDLFLSKNIEVESFIENNLLIQISEIELQRVIDNNITNAVKYSNGNSKVEISVSKVDEKALFMIKDYGIGIKDTTKIFDRFVREESNKGGFGIGLNIVKNICDKYKIKIEVSSKLGVGTTFKYLFDSK